MFRRASRLSFNRTQTEHDSKNNLKMQFTIAACVTALAALACAQTPANTAQPPNGNAIGHPELGELIPAGESFTITWAPDTGGNETPFPPPLSTHCCIQNLTMRNLLRPRHPPPTPRPLHERGPHPHHRRQHPQHRHLHLAPRAHRPRPRRHRLWRPAHRRRHRRIPILATMRRA